ncbi:MAG: hypothetical protein ABFE08_17810 [Armatimonadia bacterium]
MMWQEAVATAVVILGLFAGAFLYGRRPAFWIEFGVRIFTAVRPAVWNYLTKRMSPEDEARMHACIRRGGTWDNFRKKCRESK